MTPLALALHDLCNPIPRCPKCGDETVSSPEQPCAECLDAEPERACCICLEPAMPGSDICGSVACIDAALSAMFEPDRKEG